MNNWQRKKSLLDQHTIHDEEQSGWFGDTRSVSLSLSLSRVSMITLIQAENQWQGDYNSKQSTTTGLFLPLLPVTERVTDPTSLDIKRLTRDKNQTSRDALIVMIMEKEQQSLTVEQPEEMTTKYYLCLWYMSFCYTQHLLFLEVFLFSRRQAMEFVCPMTDGESLNVEIWDRHFLRRPCLENTFSFYPKHSWRDSLEIFLLPDFLVHETRRHCQEDTVTAGSVFCEKERMDILVSKKLNLSLSRRLPWWWCPFFFSFL